MSVVVSVLVVIVASPRYWPPSVACGAGSVEIPRRRREAVMDEALIYTLVRAADWAEAEAAGHYAGSADDRRDGFLHFSTAAQVRASAAKHRAGVADLLLVTVDAAALGGALRFEPASGGKRPGLFPHLHGVLPLAAVIRVTPLPLAEDGLHRFPDGIP